VALLGVLAGCGAESYVGAACAASPIAEAFYFGCVLNSPYHLSGTVYRDDIPW
jgi:hypothetical protein